MNTTNKSRLAMLDGLRGISALWVLLTHLSIDRAGITDHITSPIVKTLFRTIFNTGNISVGFFFILCGFLMYYLYETPTSFSSFITKRYLRIFSVLLPAVCISFIVKNSNQTLFGLSILLIVVPLIFRLCYQFGARLLQHRFAIVFAGSIIALQIISILVYLVGVNRSTALAFHSLPFAADLWFSFIVNATLTFVMGNYIAMVDGGYWSLVTEVFFYLVYPFIAWMVIRHFFKLRTFGALLFFVFSMIVLSGLSILFKHWYSLDTMHIHFAHFFTVGIILAWIIKNPTAFSERISEMLHTRGASMAILAMYLFVVGGAFWLGANTLPFSYLYISYLLSIGMGVVVYALFSQRNWLSRFCSSKPMLFFGSISFPLYVMHSPILHVLQKFLHIEKRIDHLFIYIVSGITLSILSAWYLRHMVESFYFHYYKNTRIREESQSKRKPPTLKVFLIVMASIYVLATYLAFKKDYGLSAVIIPHSTETLQFFSESTPLNTLRSRVIRGRFRGMEDNMGVILLPITHVGTLNPDQREQEKEGKHTFTFKIKHTSEAQWYSESRHISWKISEKEPYPVGFPQIAHAKNEWFDFEIVSSNASINDYTLFDTDPHQIFTIYQLDKRLLLTSPKLIITLVHGRIFTSFSNPLARFILFTGVLASVVMGAVYWFDKMRQNEMKI